LIATGWRAAFCGRDDEGVCSGAGLLSLQIYLALAALVAGVAASVQLVRVRAFVPLLLSQGLLTAAWIVFWVVALYD
jgi:hypothetical protein